MPVALAVLTRDLRLHDNPVLRSALDEGGEVVPLFVLDETILRSSYNRPNRAQFLVDCLRDLDASLRERGGRLVVRRGNWAEEVAAVAETTGAAAVHVAGDVTGYSARRLAALEERLPDTVRLDVHPESLLVVPPGTIRSSGNDHMSVFTPYHRRWEQQPLRPVLPPPDQVHVPEVRGLPLPTAQEVAPGETSPELAVGGETAARERLGTWLSSGLESYGDDGHDALGADGTSRLSPYLHFGCLSPVELVAAARTSGASGADAFVRQVAWRDFHHQVLAARPDSTRADYRARGDSWRHDDEELRAWKEGRTGYPVVDAGMRQLLREGWMHNRARLITGHFLCKTLYIDWRLGAQHFADHLLDADVANNTMNWQWVAGTGTDTRFNRTYNVVLQARRHDPHGTYVRRYVEELAALDDAYVHEPWLLPDAELEKLGYPPPIVAQEEARQRLRQGRPRT